jgi:ATP synthase protein I
MFKILVFQVVVILVVSAIAGVFGGAISAKSALAGGAAYFLPNLFFVMRLRMAITAKQAGAVGFLIGQAVKLSAVVMLLIVLPRLMEVNWPALIAGLFVVLFVNLFALLLKT